MSNTVYVVQDHRRYDKLTGQYVSVHDLSPAEEFGQLKYLLTPTAAPWAPESIINDLWEGLEGFKPGDYLLMVGNPVLCALAAVVACDITGGRISFLQWNGKEYRYSPVEAQVFDVDAPGGRG
jgi:hypothetical protein